MIDTKSIASGGLGLLAALLVACGTGCTSVLSSAGLRDLVWAGDDHASEAVGTASDVSSAGSATDPADDATAGTSPADTAADADRRKAATEEAVSRLSRLGRLDDDARATLMDTLDRTQPEDWPAVIDAFAESLAESRPPEVADQPPVADSTAEAGAADDQAPPAAALPHVVAKAALDAAEPAASEPAPSVGSSPVPAAAAVTAPVAAGATLTAASQPTGEDDPAAASEPSDAASTAGGDEPGDAAASSLPAADPLVVLNACFASRVQAWGVVDRFADDRFRPGQEVIVYFELDGLSAGRSPAGHTTCIDATLRLVDASGRELHAWSFEPIAETCRARRHDYFARYVVRLPETAAAGGCRIDLVVTDTLSGQVARAALPLEIVPPADE